MRLRELELAEFRSFRSLHLSIDSRGFRAVGPNASGKSTLLEAIAMLATTRSPRTSAEREIPNWRSGIDLAVPAYARARGVFERGDGTHTIELGLSIDEQGGRLKKLVSLDGGAVRAVDAVGQFKTVLFSPEDVALLSGPPSGRRRFLDVAIGQASRSYLRALSRYARVLEQRNSLLRALGRNNSRSRAADELAFWDSELILSGTEVLAYRLGAVAMLGARAAQHFAALGAASQLALGYAPHRISVQPPTRDDWQDPGESFRQALAASLTSALAAVRAEELRRGVTAIGPHRDDFVVSVEDVDVGRYGSRGQQRLAVIALRLAEFDLLEEAGGEPPVLLLDDVMSELDAIHRARLIKSLSARGSQLCLSASDVADLGARDLAHLPLLRVEVGAVGRGDPEQESPRTW